MTNCVSGGTCMSRSGLREGASEGESDALFGKGSGSHSRFGRIDDWLRAGSSSQCWQSARQFAEQAVALEAFDSHRKDLPDDSLRRHHMRRLKIGRAADHLAWIARRALEQHIDGG